MFVNNAIVSVTMPRQIEDRHQSFPVTAEAHHPKSEATYLRSRIIKAGSKIATKIFFEQLYFGRYLPTPNPTDRPLTHGSPATRRNMLSFDDGHGWGKAWVAVAPGKTAPKLAKRPSTFDFILSAHFGLRSKNWYQKWFGSFYRQGDLEIGFP